MVAEPLAGGGRENPDLTNGGRFELQAAELCCTRPILAPSDFLISHHNRFEHAKYALFQKGLSSGACAATVLLKNGEMLVSNVGDRRIVMSRKGLAEALTTDHRPGREDERIRMENLGGYVNFHSGIWRVQDSLAISRSLGDANMKEWIVSEPETKRIPLTQECEFLIMASDGLWDKKMVEFKYSSGPLAVHVTARGELWLLLYLPSVRDFALGRLHHPRASKERSLALLSSPSKDSSALEKIRSWEEEDGSTWKKGILEQWRSRDRDDHNLNKQRMHWTYLCVCSQVQRMEGKHQNSECEISARSAGAGLEDGTERQS
ncbi:putative protein phosphatase 2C 14 [Platanthera guangdongensis]|uniref:protein-serine/threonine phosphatase n=1 Tax=Platanthera guangdongensis TaxID=2320717 RepID=A0ABR2LSB0_9ASPA